MTLTGEVAQFGGKSVAEDITKRVKGVRAIVNQIHTKIKASSTRSDTDIAAAANALRWNVATVASQIPPIVKDGYVTLSGEVQWGLQKTSAENAVRNLMGVKGISNDIRVATTLSSSKHRRDS